MLLIPGPVPQLYRRQAPAAGRFFSCAFVCSQPVRVDLAEVVVFKGLFGKA
jgi:hypothetical protein